SAETTTPWRPAAPPRRAQASGGTPPQGRRVGLETPGGGERPGGTACYAARRGLVIPDPPSSGPDPLWLTGEAQEGAEQHVGATLERRPVRPLIWPVAPAALAGHEDHARLRHRRQDLGVVTGAGRHAPGPEPELLGCRLDGRLDARGHQHRVGPHEVLHLEDQPPLARDAP